MSVTVFVCLSVWLLSSPGPLEVWEHEWYHVVTNCQGHVLSPAGLPKVAKNRQKKPKPSQRHVAQPKDVNILVANRHLYLTL